MRESDDFAKVTGLEKLYEEGRRLFLAGKLEDAQEQFKRVYELDCSYRDVAGVVEDSFSMPEDAWHRKYRPRFLSESN